MRWESILARVGVVAICAGGGWESIAFVCLEFGWVYSPAATKVENCRSNGILGRHVDQ
jgi:hypothetical protein